MYVYTVARIMRTANELFSDGERDEEIRNSLVLYLILAAGAGLLGFFTWLCTL